MFLDLYLAALDEELLPRLASISDYKSTYHPIDWPIWQMFRGTFRSTMDARNRLDSVTVEDWRSLQLDIQVIPLPFPPPIFFDQIKVRVTDLQSLHSLIQYNLYKMHSFASHGRRNPYRPARLPQAKEASKRSSRTFRPYSSSISSASSDRRASCRERV